MFRLRVPRWSLLSCFRTGQLPVFCSPTHTQGFVKSATATNNTPLTIVNRTPVSKVWMLSISLMLLREAWRKNAFYWTGYYTSREKERKNILLGSRFSVRVMFSCAKQNSIPYYSYFTVRWMMQRWWRESKAPVLRSTDLHFRRKSLPASIHVYWICWNNVGPRSHLTGHHLMKSTECSSPSTEESEDCFYLPSSDSYTHCNYWKLLAFWREILNNVCRTAQIYSCALCQCSLICLHHSNFLASYRNNDVK